MERAPKITQKNVLTQKHKKLSWMVLPNQGCKFAKLFHIKKNNRASKSSSNKKKRLYVFSNTKDEQCQNIYLKH